MKSKQLTPLLLLAIGCNSILGIDDHELAPNAGGLGAAGTKAVGNAGPRGQ